MKFHNAFFSQLFFFISENRLFYIFLIFFAILIAFFEGLNITLLYPIISMGLGMDTNLSPYPRVFSFLAESLPVNSVFVGLILVFILLTTFLLIIQLLYWKLSYIFTKKVIIFVKKNLYKKLFTCDYHLFEDKKQGELINLVNTGPQMITYSFELIMSLIADISLAVIVLLFLFTISPLGLVITIFGGFVYYVINNWISKTASNQLGELNFSSQQAESVLITEYISGVRTIIALNRVKNWEKLIKNALMLYWDSYPQLRFLQRLPGLLIYSLFLNSIGFLILSFYTYYPESFSFIIPIFGTYTVGLLRILPKITSIGFNYMQVVQCHPYLSAVYDFLTVYQYNDISNGEKKFFDLESEIAFDNVSFSYGEIQVLRKLSFTIRKGETTAIVGPSGAGKSTITSILLRLYDPDYGRVIVNNSNLKNYDIGSFRDRIGYVGQEAFVFNASIRENILFGGVYSHEEVKKAAILAHADTFIENLPEGYETIIGDRGIKLSGGEKQRIVIARAMIRNPDILILDEATASLDNISEGLVQSALDEVSKGCTTLVIAHRLTTIQNAHKIYVIDNGTMVEEGSHHELLERKGLYWGLYTRMKNNHI